MSDPGAAGGHVFLCYAREDSARIDELAGVLRAAGIRVWRDTAELSPGQDWRVQIRRAIDDSALVFLACFSVQGQSRPVRYQNVELALAADQARLHPVDASWLIPVRFDDCEIPDLDLGANRRLASVQRADLFGPQRDAAIARLTNAILRIIQGQPDRPGRPDRAAAPPLSPVPAGESAKVRVLFLAANPVRTARLALDEEYRQIGQKIRLAGGRDLFELIGCWAVRPDDLLQGLNEHRPHIVHFSGHGSQDGEIMLSGENGRDQPVSARALERLFSLPSLTGQTQIVVLNACYTAIQAEAIAKHIDYVVGMPAAVGDRAAAVFAASFYRALGFGRDVPEAFEQACIAIDLEGLAQHQPDPVLLTGERARPWTMPVR